MGANFLIGLREGLEAALVVSILVAYLVKAGRRDLLPRIWLGVGIAVVISLGFGAALTFGPKGLTFEAQEAIGGTLSIIAVGLITWMILWMAKTARSLKTTLTGDLEQAIQRGGGAVMVMALLAVGREGLETALFLWAGAQATGQSTRPLVGAVLGVAVAILLGWLAYRGAIRLNLGLFFRWTGLFLVIVAAGVLCYGVHDLQEAGILPGLNSLAFDVSHIIAPAGVLGTFLKGIFNFTPATTWLQAIAWIVYMAVALPIFLRVAWASPARTAATPTPHTQGDR